MTAAQRMSQLTTFPWPCHGPSTIAHRAPSRPCEGFVRPEMPSLARSGFVQMLDGLTVLTLSESKARLQSAVRHTSGG